jgi:hypothetical protein
VVVEEVTRLERDSLREAQSGGSKTRIHECMYVYMYVCMRACARRTGTGTVAYVLPLAQELVSVFLDYKYH